MAKKAPKKPPVAAEAPAALPAHFLDLDQLKAERGRLEATPFPEGFEGLAAARGRLRRCKAGEDVRHVYGRPNKVVAAMLRGWDEALVADAYLRDRPAEDDARPGDDGLEPMDYEWLVAAGSTPCDGRGHAHRFRLSAGDDSGRPFTAWLVLWHTDDARLCRWFDGEEWSDLAAWSEGVPLPALHTRGQLRALLAVLRPPF